MNKEEDYHIFPKENISKILSIDRDEEFNIKMNFVFTKDFHFFMKNLRKNHGKKCGMDLADKIIDYLEELNNSKEISSSEIVTALASVLMFFFDRGSTGMKVIPK